MDKKPNIGALLNPKTVAIIGAAPKGQGIRGRIMEVLTAHTSSVKLYPVSRNLTEVQGLKAYPSIEACPEPVDLAIFVIPAKFVAAELERCGKAGVKAAIIISSGFSEEPGETGARMQSELREIADRYGMAVNGPNSEGYTAFETSFCPTFSPAVVPSGVPLMPEHLGNGRIAVIAQSGGMGFAFYDRGRPKEMAFNYVVTTGNEACLEIFDYVEHLIDEGRTDAFCLLIEDVKTPATFKRVAEKALRAGIPLIVNKIGKTDAGARAAASHTAALAGSYNSFQALAKHYGLIEGSSLEEMVDIAQGFLAWKGKMPSGKRVGICTASGGGGGWMADTCAQHGLEVPTLDAATRAKIDPLLPSYGTSQNPVDGTAQAVRAIGYGGMASLVVGSPVVDGIIVVMSGRAAEHLVHEASKLAELRKSSPKPILMWSYTLPAAASVKVLSECGYPLFTNMQHAVITMRAMAEWQGHRTAFLAQSKPKSAGSSAMRKVADLLAKDGDVLTEADAKPVLAAYGIGTVAAEKLVQTRDAAIAAAKALGKPVALKVQSPDILHNTEAGAVALNAKTPEEVGAAYDKVLTSAKKHAPKAAIQGVLVQAMAEKGREVILGINRDQHFGPMLMLGLGGIHVEVLKDVAFAPVPLTADASRTLIGRLKGAGVLDAHRGQPAADKAALVDLIVKLGQLAADHADDIAEIDLNPVIVHTEGMGATVADALIVKRRE